MAKDGYWACARLDDNGYITDQYMGAVEEYITFAMNEQWFTSGDRIRCPCVKCQKHSFLKHDDVRRHLYYTGFCNDPLSGVGQSSRVRAEVEHEYSVEVENPYANMVRDAFYANLDHSWNSDGGSMSMDPEPSLRPSSFFSLLNDADEPVWSGCTKHTTLSAVSQLLNCKSEFNISENCFNRLMVIIKGILPENNNLPENYYQMKKKMAAFGLRYVKIDVCDNNCMLFNGEFEELEYCSEKELKRKPTYGELFNRTHKREKGQGDFVDHKSKNVSETYTSSMSQKYGSDESNHPEFDPEVWCDAIGGRGTTRTHFYGFGITPRGKNCASTSINAGDASYSACSRLNHEHAQTPLEVDNLREEVTLMKDRFINLEDKVEKQASDTADIKKYLEQMMEMFNPARMFSNASVGPSQPTS